MGKHLSADSFLNSPEALKRLEMDKKACEIAEVVRDLADVGERVRLPQNVIETAEAIALEKCMSQKEDRRRSIF